MGLDEVDHKRGLITNLDRRKKILETKKAKLGLTVDPSLIIEIEDIDHEIKKPTQEINTIQSMKKNPVAVTPSVIQKN